MPLGPLVLVLASALLHAGWNALLRREADTSIAALAILSTAATAGAIVAIVVGNQPFPGFPALAWGAGAAAFEAAYFITLSLALRAAPLGVTYTVSRSGAMLIVWPLSVVLLGERVLPLTVGGAVLVALGLALTHLQRRPDVPPTHLNWAYACAACIAGYHLCYGRALDLGLHAPALFAIGLCLAIPPYVAWLGRNAPKQLFAFVRQNPGWVMGTGLMCAVSFLAFIAALRDAGAGAVLTLRNTSVVFAQLFAFAIGERPTNRQLLGAALVAVGSALVASSR